MDWFPILSSIGTIIVALVTLFNTFNIRKQLRLIERQTLTNRSSIYPFLSLLNWTINNDIIEVKLKNKGKGPAFFLGIRSRFIPLELSKDQWNFIEVLSEVEKGKSHKIFPGDTVTFLKNKNNSSRLYPEEEDTFLGKIFFQYKYKKEDAFTGKFFTYDELNKLILANNIKYAAISLQIVYKDITESIFESLDICFITIDFMKQQKLEEAVKNGLPFTQRTIDPETELEFISWDFYRKGKSPRAFLTE